MISQHFVKFLCPGTFVHEEDHYPIASWDVEAAISVAKTVVVRHGAKPFAFEFYTKARSDAELDSKVVATSPRYYLGGTIETLDQVEQRADPKEEILLSNMKSNGLDKIIINTNSWKVTQPFGENDVLLEVSL